MGKSVTIKDIAKCMNVSLSTVNKALTGKPGISDARREEILKVSREMGYVSNNVAQIMARNPMTVGIILPDQWQEYFHDISDGMRREFEHIQKYKINSTFYTLTTRDIKDDQFIKEWLKEENVSAVVLCASVHPAAKTIEGVLEKSGLPIFQLGDEQHCPGVISRVTIDANQAGKLAGDFLKCACRGEIRSAVVTGSMEVESHRIKAEAFSQRLEENGGKVVAVLESRDDPQLVYEDIQKLFIEHKDINAIYVCTSTSVPVCRYIEEKQLKDHITLITTDIFDELRTYMKKDVVKATIFQNQEQLGKSTVHSAYEYLVKKNTFSNEEYQPEERIFIKPVLYLKANIE